MRRAAEASPPRRDRYAREAARRIDSDEELGEERAAASKGEAYDPFTDALDGARSVHELSGKAAVPPPPSLYQRGGGGASASWRGRGGRDDRHGGRGGGGGGATVMGFSLAALAKMPAQRKGIWAKPAAAAAPSSAPHAPPQPSQQAARDSGEAGGGEEPVSVWQGAEFDDAAKKAKFLALMGARNLATAPAAPPAAARDAELAEREQQLAATYAAAATHTRGTGLGAGGV